MNKEGQVARLVEDGGAADVDMPVAQLDLANLYARHRQGLFTCALLIVRCPQRAEDAVHDAFARMCRRSDLSAIEDPVAYTYAAVRAAAIDLVRKRGPTLVEPVSIFAPDGPDARAEQAERAVWVSSALADLPADQREVIVLKIYAGLTFAQIAQVMGEPLQTVATRYRRSLEKLRDRLEKLV